MYRYACSSYYPQMRNCITRGLPGRLSYRHKQTATRKRLLMIDAMNDVFDSKRTSFSIDWLFANYYLCSMEGFP